MASRRFRIARLRLVPLWQSWRGHFFELGLYIGLYLVYLVTRGLVYPGQQTALDNAARVISLERSAGFFWEPGWQAWAINHAQLLVVLLNWVYIITYWPIILLMALVLYLFNRRLYGYYRTVVVISLAGALVVYALFPLAPPRLVPEPLTPAPMVDTIRAFGPSYYGSPQMETFYNARAAMPSLHFGLTLLLGVLFIRALPRWVKPFGLIYPALTFFSITVTANHYILDALAGGLLTALAFAVMELGLRRRLFLARWWPRLRALAAESGMGRFRYSRRKGT